MFGGVLSPALLIGCSIGALVFHIPYMRGTLMGREGRGIMQVCTMLESPRRDNARGGTGGDTGIDPRRGVEGGVCGED